MMNNLRTVTCPTCKGVKGWCEQCYGSGLVVLEQRTPYRRARLWQIGLLLVVAAAVILIVAGIR